MSVWGEVFLGVIALATLVMAIGQVALFVAASRLARRVAGIADVLDRELKPLFAQLNGLVRDASRAATLAAAQVERADRLFADLASRLESTAALVQEAVAAPMRQGSAVMAAFRVAFNILRDVRSGRRRRRPDDEDALFI